MLHGSHGDCAIRSTAICHSELNCERFERPSRMVTPRDNSSSCDKPVGITWKVLSLLLPHYILHSTCHKFSDFFVSFLKIPSFPVFFFFFFFSIFFSFFFFFFFFFFFWIFLKKKKKKKKRCYLILLCGYPTLYFC